MFWKPLKLYVDENVLLLNLFFVVTVNLTEILKKSFSGVIILLNVIEGYKQNNILIYAISTDNWFL